MKISRREVLGKLAAGAALAAIPINLPAGIFKSGKIMKNSATGKINHSACRWCYQDIPLDVLCEEGKRIGLSSIDLVGPGEWAILKSHGLTCAMGNGAELGLTKGWNTPEYHAELIKKYEEIIPVASSQEIKNIICFSGNRGGMDDETGLNNCVKGLKKVIGLAEKNNVVLVMELLNSKIDHKDYQCDHSAWGVELCKRIGSENFRLLYDIYHMQIMEGDVIRTIKANYQYFAHYHTGGVPGRHEIDQTQELNYPAIMKAILETGYTGFVAQEFIPTGENKLSSLKKCIEICNV
jgi:hydroxypyruvate isomerase